MRTLRTPDDCFRDLPGYAFAPHYADIPSGDDTGETARCASTSSTRDRRAADRSC